MMLIEYPYLYIYIAIYSDFPAIVHIKFYCTTVRYGHNRVVGGMPPMILFFTAK